MTDRNLARIFALGMLLLFTAAPALAGDGELRHFKLPELARVLKSEGYGSIKVNDDHVRFKANGRTFGLYLYDDGDLQMYFGIAGVSLTAENLNEWNKNYRLSRAYLDDEGDPVLEADLLANAGINSEIIIEFVKVFVDSSAQYRSFVIEHEQAPTAPPASRRGGASF